MRLFPNQLDERSLCFLGEEVAVMLAKEDFCGLAERFGYALAEGRDPAAAIVEDFLKAKSAACVETRSKGPPISVKYFEPNSANLVAVVECIVSSPERTAVLLELIVTVRGEEWYITLEDISNVV